MHHALLFLYFFVLQIVDILILIELFFSIPLPIHFYGVFLQSFILVRYSLFKLLLVLLKGIQCPFGHSLRFYVYCVCRGGYGLTLSEMKVYRCITLQLLNSFLIWVCCFLSIRLIWYLFGIQKRCSQALTNTSGELLVDRKLPELGLRCLRGAGILTLNCCFCARARALHPGPHILVSCNFVGRYFYEPKLAQPSH